MLAGAGRVPSHTAPPLGYRWFPRGRSQGGRGRGTHTADTPRRPAQTRKDTACGTGRRRRDEALRRRRKGGRLALQGGCVREEDATGERGV